jgi:arylsulfatase
MVGKWHVGDKNPNHPTDRGFDEYFGLIPGGSAYWKTAAGPVLTRNDVPEQVTDEKFYITDAFSDNAVALLDRHGKGGKPFFLYLAYTAPHWPLHAWPKDVAKYKDLYLKGWDELRAARHKRQVETGLIKPDWKITDRDAPPWADVKDKEAKALRMAVYAAQIDRMDYGVGKVLAKIRELGAEENTLVLFLSDNGGCAEIVERGTKGVPAGEPGSFLSYGREWANLSNTPFRLYKHWVHEGGISTPLIAYWPKVITKGGGLVHDPTHLIDVMPTFAEAAAAEYPKTRDGKAVPPMEGRSIVPVFEGKAPAAREALYWEHEGNRAVRQGKWKLVGRNNGKWELYDMEADRTETDDLAAKDPEKVKEMSALYDAWAARCNVERWGKVQAAMNRKPAAPAPPAEPKGKADE